ncbi:MAG: P22 phage major capsid protein family protein [Gammaproteobacteria bacterium]|nr:P22 phage major capsid protein family protein [Gammaproteobacteria bacterium]
MANVLTRLIPDLYEAADIVSRELVGLVPAVSLWPGAERAAVNEDIVIHQAPASTASDITPGQNPPDDGDQTIGNTTVTITKARSVPFRWTGEEQKGVNNGPGYRRIQVDQIAQAFRTLTNEVEADLALQYKLFSRAYGTAGTTPFASDVSDTAQVKKILKDNGSPQADLQLVLGTTAGAKLLSLGQLSKVNESGDTGLLRQGVFGDLHGFAVRESNAIVPVTKGTGASSTTNAAGYAVGATVITLASAGTGTILAGDVITFAGDTNKYVVASGDADVSNGGTITLAAPGLRVAIAASATAITVGANYTPNMAFHRSSIILVARPPAVPEEGDQAMDSEMIVDERSGIVYEVRVYPQYRRVRYEVCLAWGSKNIKPAHSAILLG